MSEVWWAGCAARWVVGVVGGRIGSERSPVSGVWWIARCGGGVVEVVGGWGVRESGLEGAL